jgi:hypothetical protein
VQYIQSVEYVARFFCDVSCQITVPRQHYGKRKLLKTLAWKKREGNMKAERGNFR